MSDRLEVPLMATGAVLGCVVFIAATAVVLETIHSGLTWLTGIDL